MQKLLIISGPTATGKSDLGIELARKFDGEIVSADSRHVYRGMDIGTGKDIPSLSRFVNMNAGLGIKNPDFTVGYRTREEIPVWLVDVVAPAYRFNLGEYLVLAGIILEDIWSRNKLPVVVGGTGLYIKGLIAPLDLANVPPQEKLREELEELFTEDLRDRLKKIDPEKFESLNSSDSNNPRRLIRAIELASSEKGTEKSFIESSWLNIILNVELPALFEKIDTRVDKRMHDGALAEIKKLHDAGFEFRLPAFTATGYRLFEPYLNGVSGMGILEDCVLRWKYREHKVARHQRTWFKKMAATEIPGGRSVIFDMGSADYKEKIEDEVAKWYTSGSKTEEK